MFLYGFYAMHAFDGLSTATGCVCLRCKLSTDESVAGANTAETASNGASKFARTQVNLL